MGLHLFSRVHAAQYPHPIFGGTRSYCIPHYQDAKHRAWFRPQTILAVDILSGGCLPPLLSAQCEDGHCSILYLFFEQDKAQLLHYPEVRFVITMDGHLPPSGDPPSLPLLLLHPPLLFPPRDQSFQNGSHDPLSVVRRAQPIAHHLWTPLLTGESEDVTDRLPLQGNDGGVERMTVEDLSLSGGGVGREGGGEGEGVVCAVLRVSVGNEGVGIGEEVGTGEVRGEVLSDALIAGVSGDVGSVTSQDSAKAEGEGRMGNGKGKGWGGGTAVKTPGGSRRWGSRGSGRHRGGRVRTEEEGALAAQWCEERVTI